MLEYMGAIFATLFVVIDPIGLTPVFLALTKHYTTSQIRKTALKSTLIAFGILVAFAWLGDSLMRHLGISIEAFSVAGGLLLFLIAIDMVTSSEPTTDATADPGHDPTVFPIAIPLIAGPGGLATMALLIRQNSDDVVLQIGVLCVLVAIMIATLLCLLLAGVIGRVLGRTGTSVITRIFGLILAAVAVQFVMDGLGDYLSKF